MPSKKAKTNPLDNLKDEPIMARAIVDADDEGEYDFSYSSDISEAERPPVLPPRDYVAEVVSYKRTQTQKGKPNITLVLNVSPDQFPVDFNGESAPDGVNVNWRSQDLSDTFQGRYNAKKVAQSFKIERRTGFKEGDFMHKKVKFSLEHYDSPDGPIAVVSLNKLPEVIG